MTGAAPFHPPVISGYIISASKRGSSHVVSFFLIGFAIDRRVNIAECQSLWRFAPQHVELVSKDKDLGFQRSPRPEQSDEGTPDQPAKIAHRKRVSADSRSWSAVLGLR
jgi:hypothetical protein